MALLNEILGWDFGQFLQRMKEWENATLGVQQNCKCATTGRGAGGCVEFLDLRRKFGHTCMCKCGRETARLSHVRQLLHDYLRAGKAWKAPRTEEFAEAHHSNVVPMDVDSLHRKGGKVKGKNKGDRNRHDGRSKK